MVREMLEMNLDDIVSADPPLMITSASAAIAVNTTSRGISKSFHSTHNCYNYRNTPIINLHNCSTNTSTSKT